jgi:hypothetical protein
MSLTKEQSQAKLPYLTELGGLVYAWNDLQQKLGLLFAKLLSPSKQGLGFALWQSSDNDRLQRAMLHSIVKERWRLKLTAAQQHDVLWLLDETNKLADARNDAIHSPYTLQVDVSGRVSVIPFWHAGSRRAKKLQGKDLLEALVWYRARAETLAEYANSLYRVSSSRSAWPNRPRLPALNNLKG